MSTSIVRLKYRVYDSVLTEDLFENVQLCMSEEEIDEMYQKLGSFLASLSVNSHEEENVLIDAFKKGYLAAHIYQYKSSKTEPELKKEIDKNEPQPDTNKLFVENAIDMAEIRVGDFEYLAHLYGFPEHINPLNPMTRVIGDLDRTLWTLQNHKEE